MTEKEFNLLTEPWIRVMDEDCCVREVSLTDALLNAHKFRNLAGELPTQDAAVLRLLLAVLHAVFERVNINGKQSSIETADDALDRWAELWEAGRFPQIPIRNYLEHYQDRFWLFHPTKPFFQVLSAVNGTAYEASKLNGSLSESSNKVRLFSERTGIEKNRLTYAEAARWLLYVNAYDDTSAKPTKQGKSENDGKLPSPGAGWLGKIGYICINGNSLFETLMLNFVLLSKDGQPWSSAVPQWEQNKPNEKERVEIPAPNDQAALLTLQSRRLMLKRDKAYVTGFFLLGGDFFEKINAFVEQMTVWGAAKDAKGNVIGAQPKRHKREKQLWRDFEVYTTTEQIVPKPGVLLWNAQLQYNRILPVDMTARLSIVAVQYGDKDFFAADVFSDQIELYLNMLNDIGRSYRDRVIREIQQCDKFAGYIGQLGKELFLAGGGDGVKAKEPMSQAREQYYFEIDMPFRKWLSTLNAQDDEEIRNKRFTAWRSEAIEIAYELANTLCRNAGPKAFVGKTLQVDGKGNIVQSGGRKKLFSSSMAIQHFKFNMSKRG